jgi:hypothetical protein
MSNGKRIKENRLAFLFRLMSPRLHVSMSSCLHVSIVSVFPCLHVSGIPKRKTEPSENGN